MVGHGGPNGCPRPAGSVDWPDAGRGAAIGKLTAAWVVPGDGPAIPRGRVAIEGETVTWLGAPGDPGEPPGTTRDLGSGVLLPGLVNAHCHLELSHLQTALAGIDTFVEWVDALVTHRSDAGPESVRAQTAAAIRQLEETGTVAVGDVSNSLAHLDLLGASTLSTVVFFELLGWDAAEAPGLLASARARLAEKGGPNPAPNVEVRLAAHAPHSAAPALLAALVGQGGPAALHLAESPAESRFLAEGDGAWAGFLVRRGLGHVAFKPPGLSPVAYADRLGVLHPGLVAAHCVQTDDRDLAVLAARGVAVAVCPRSNRRLGVGMPPLPRMLEAGVRLSLGTDSLASAPDLDLLAEAVTLHREFPALDPALLIRMATAGGATALGLRDLGTIAAGKRAALAYAEAATRPRDPFAFLVSGDARSRRVIA